MRHRAANAYTAAVFCAGVSSIFLDMDGFEKIPAFMLRRTLLEFVAIRYAVGDVHCVHLGRLLADADISSKGREASLVLRAVAQNKAVYVDHQELYNTHYLSPFLDMDVLIECDLWLVEKWVSKAGGGSNVFTFASIPQGIRDAMIRGLDDSIDKLKKHLAAYRFDDKLGRYVRRDS